MAIDGKLIGTINSLVGNVFVLGKLEATYATSGGSKLADKYRDKYNQISRALLNIDPDGDLEMQLNEISKIMES